MSSKRRSLVRPLALAMVIAGLLGAWAWIGDEPEPPSAALPKRTRRAEATAVSQAKAPPTASATVSADRKPSPADSVESSPPTAPAPGAGGPIAVPESSVSSTPAQATVPRSDATATATEATQAAVSSSPVLDDPPKAGSIQSPLRAMLPPSGAVVPVPLEAVSPKVVRYAERLVQQYDEDQDGQLSEAEWQPFGESFRVSDLDRDGVITVDEVARRIAAYARRRTLHSMPLAAPTPAEIAAASPTTSGNAASGSGGLASAPPRPARRYFVPAGRLPGGLPEWFNERDTDGDGQLTLAEFAPDARPELALEFEAFDANRDGVITSQEGAREQSRRTAAEAEAAAQAAAAQAAANPVAPVATAPRP
ncbi:MAG: hypothetical protein K2Y37_11790 [Pirellulales bacterium]|nr:hypothetical protein [Pirellulales bacterium]